MLDRTLPVVGEAPLGAGEERRVTVDVRALSPGRYLIRATLAAEAATRPLTVAR